MTLNEKFGVVISGKEIYWVKDGTRKKQPASLTWNREKNEYAWGHMAIRRSEEGFQLMNYSNGVLGGLKKASMDSLKK